MKRFLHTFYLVIIVALVFFLYLQQQTLVELRKEKARPDIGDQFSIWNGPLNAFLALEEDKEREERNRQGVHKAVDFAEQYDLESYQLKRQSGKTDGFQYQYFPDGSIQAESRWWQGLPDGDVVLLYEGGKRKEEGKFESGKLQGDYKTYYPDGQLESHYNYFYGKASGLARIYYPGGQVKIETIWNRGKQTILYRVFDEKGKRIVWSY